MTQLKRSEFLAAAFAEPVDDSRNSNPPANKNANQRTPNFDAKSLSGLDTYTGRFEQAQLMHLLRRTMFGVTQADLNYFSGMTLQQVVAELLTPAATPAPPLNNYSANVADPDVAAGQPWVTAAYESGAIDNARRQSLKAWWVGLMLNQNRSITEKMTLFWMNHFSTQMATVADARYSYKTLAMMRANALGNFKTLAREVITDPGMLVYLNGNTNTLNNPNENFGREFQELMTVGKGPNSLYTQNDVIELAHVFTGWVDHSSTITSSFVPSKHDTSNKQFSSFYNNTIIIGQSGAAGATETDDAVAMIFGQIEAAKFLSRCLYYWFLYYVIDDNIEANVITPLANIMIENNFEIVPVLTALFQSEHFFDPMNVGCQIKNPVDHLVGLCRQFGVVFPDSSNLANQYTGWFNIAELLNTLAMDPGDPPNVAGWPAYYQEPEYHELWINSDTFPLRNEYSAVLGLQNGWTNGGVTLQLDFMSFTSQLPNPSDPNQLIADAWALLSPNALGSDESTVLYNTLLNGLANGGYWTTAWDEYASDPSNQTYLNTVLSRLRPMYNYILSLAEYQLI